MTEELQKEGKLHIITGFGKYKSSSAFGTSLRAINQDWKILITQFLKGQESGEISVLKKYFPNNVDILRYGANKIVLPNNIVEFDKEETQRGFQDMLSKIKEGKNYKYDSDLTFNKPYDLLILDEILVAVDLKLISQKQFFDFLNNKPDKLEIICTGRVTDKSFMHNLTIKSNLHSDIFCKKHYCSRRCIKCKRSWEWHYSYCPNCGTELQNYTSARLGLEL